MRYVVERTAVAAAGSSGFAGWPGSGAGLSVLKGVSPGKAAEGTP